MNSIKKRTEKLLAKMTLDEKLAQIGSCWMYDLQTSCVLDQVKMTTILKYGIGQITRLAGVSTYDPMDAAKASNNLQKFLVENTRLGIPAIIHEECCSGVNMLGGTTFPQMLGLASTFNPELAKKMTATIREQMLAIGARQGLAPVLDVARDPRWGRVEETFGEDPMLVSHFGMAYINGLQNTCLSQGVMATGKHFFGHSMSEGGLNCAPVHMGLCEAHDVLLAPFQAAIRDAGLASIMNAYPEFDGEVVAASRRILSKLLREKLGFNGVVVSDYEAVIMLHNFHYVADDPAHAAALALNAGIDVELPTTVCYGDALKTALERGEIDLSLVDVAVKRHVTKKFELGLFENPYVDAGRVLEVFETPEQRTLTREIARQSIVLLKNDGLLPLNKTIDTIAVIGPNANSGRNLLGDYSYASMSQLSQFQAINEPAIGKVDLDQLFNRGIQVTTVLNGIQLAVSPQTKVLYTQGCDNLSNVVSDFDKAVQIAQQSDVVVLVLGDCSGLVPTCTTGETRDSADLRLPGVQEELAKAIVATEKPVAVVLTNGRPYAISWLAENANSILEAWLPGEEGGSAIADILFGDANPGGKLPISFPRSVGQIPIYYNKKVSGTKSHWYGDYVYEKVTPLYPFGYGLSYTTFSYDQLAISRQTATSGEYVDISLQIKNTGQVPGEEVVQLYIRDPFASSPRPVKELKGYQRLLLHPDEQAIVTFHLPVDQLAFYNNDLELVLEAGQIDVMVGSSSADIRLTGKFEIIGPAKMIVKDRIFECPVRIS
jgi:beta-xylosidase